MKTTLLIFLNLYLVYSTPTIQGILDDASDCKKACHPLVEGKINVHLIPHSHDDLGWLRTFDEYYEGTKGYDNFESAGVQYIISSVINALKANPNRRYIQVETGFFWKWWQEQSKATREDTINLVNNGQLEMTNGGWSMNDEAAAQYHSIIDQFTWGFRKLEDTVGKCGRPKVSWQIDPFGHSREHASIVKQLGFEGLVIGRIDYRDKARRQANKSLDFIWNTNPNFDDSKMFTTMFPNFYFEEDGFCFDVICTDADTDFVVLSKVKRFAEILDEYKHFYKTNNIMMPMGRDFSYQKASQNFQRLDRFIDGFKNHVTYNVMYSTPSCYIQAVKNEVARKSITLEEKSDDFFPYASDSDSFWTGYFTSRPTSKRFERVGNNILQSVKQLIAFARVNNKKYDKNLGDLRGVMGVLQHHDSITGTAKQYVSDDYVKMLHQAITKAEEPLGVIIGDLLKKDADSVVDLKLSSCLLANVSICEKSQEDQFVVAVYNPLSQVVTHYIHLPVDGDSYKITGPDGEEVYDIFDTIHNFDYINERSKPTSKELVFAAKNLPALGIKVYYVEKVIEPTVEYKPFEELLFSLDANFGTETNGFDIDINTGTLSSVTIKGVTLKITQEFMFYPSYTSASGSEYRASGAYIFRPGVTDASPMTKEEFTSVKFVKGNLLDQCIQVINDEVTQIIKVYKDKKEAYIEFDWLVGNLHLDNVEGKEVITRFTIRDFSNNKTFYTDANGRQQIERKLNTRSDFTYDPSQEPVSSNYYPVTSKIVIKDEAKKLEVAVLNDRAQGGSSLKDGTVELMIHRRLTEDDQCGVAEVLDEEQYGKGLYARGQHYLTFGSTESKVENEQSTAAFERELAHKILLAPLVFVGDATTEKYSTVEELRELIEFKFEGLKKVLPDNVQILTLEPWKNSYILRLEHILEKNEDDILSTPVTVNLNNFFTLFDITEISETKLGANELLTYGKRYMAENLLKQDLMITLNPMEIKTFILKTNKNNKGDDDENAIAKASDHTCGAVLGLIIVAYIVQLL